MLAVKTLVMSDTYRDSVFLMKLSSQAREESGAVQISAMMGTPRNKELFIRSGLNTPEVEAAKADDLVIAVQAEDAMLDHAMATVTSLLESAPAKKTTKGAGAESIQSLPHLFSADKNFSLALISVAGDYARYEAALALKGGLDVMLYSDNISLADELALKQMAAKKKLLVMGPDCGTAIIDGVPLAFANTVSTGAVGLIAASGTGLQEVICLLDRLGSGVSQAYGTGGRDLKDDIGGLTTLAALERLLEDPNTKLIGIIGKPPGQNSRKKLLELIKKSPKPVAVHFLGAENYADEDAAGIKHAPDLTSFAVLLAEQANSCVHKKAVVKALPEIPSGHNGYMRGLFSGGTLCQEAAELSAAILKSELYSNLAVGSYTRLTASEPSKGHAFWDFGDDEFTVGRPHPMMAPEQRMEALIKELCDPLVGVVLLDLVIGYGSALGQAEAMVKALAEADKKSGGKSRKKLVVASVCGTEKDNPARASQVEILQHGGIIVLESNAQASIWAAKAARGEK